MPSGWSSPGRSLLLLAILAVGVAVLVAYTLPRRALEARERRRVQSIMVPR